MQQSYSYNVGQTKNEWILYDSIYVKFEKKNMQNSPMGKEIQVVVTFGWIMIEREHQGDFCDAH